MNFLLAVLITTLTLWILRRLSTLGPIEVSIENEWLRAGGTVPRFIVIYEMIRRTVFGGIVIDNIIPHRYRGATQLIGRQSVVSPVKRRACMPRNARGALF